MSHYDDDDARLIRAGLDPATAETVASELVPPPPVDPLPSLVEAMFDRRRTEDDTPKLPGHIASEHGTPDQSGGSSELQEFVADLFGRP